LLGNPTNIAGIPLPSDAPLFLAFIGIHVAAGVVCVVAGAVAMLSRKRPGRHPQAGSVYYWALTAVFVTMAAITVFRWAEDHDLFFLGALSLGSATIGRMARRGLWPYWATIHIVGMGGSYISLLTAFYVDNGSNLPLWRELPPLAFWLLPAAIGSPILARALLRHPSVRR
jgi:hypothetical protein